MSGRGVPLLGNSAAPDPKACCQVTVCRRRLAGCGDWQEPTAPSTLKANKFSGHSVPSLAPRLVDWGACPTASSSFRVPPCPKLCPGPQRGRPVSGGSGGPRSPRHAEWPQTRRVAHGGGVAREGGWTWRSLPVWAGNAIPGTSPPRDVCAHRHCSAAKQGCCLRFSWSLPFRTGHGTLVTEVMGCRADREIPSWMLNWVRLGGVRSGSGEAVYFTEGQARFCEGATAVCVRQAASGRTVLGLSVPPLETVRVFLCRPTAGHDVSRVQSAETPRSAERCGSREGGRQDSHPEQV